jgi:hypothetical protein
MKQILKYDFVAVSLVTDPRSGRPRNRGLIYGRTSAVSAELPAVAKNFFPQTLSLVPVSVKI